MENMLSFDEFVNIVKEEVQMELPESDVTVTEILKQNDIKLSGINIKDKNSNVCPTHYLNGYYDLYTSEQRKLEEIVIEIIRANDRLKISSIDANWLNDWNSVKNKSCK